ncbi:MAG TPA: hypothetical protein VIA06_02230 [Candidatus Dormibacteraeota bacterium]|jgi:chloramphenicol 3-O-phosphotransferase|nr:hypothetical protein [Candidatus Dormibacteraeota bacterium]
MPQPSRIIVLNGPTGVGKTTTGRLLARRGRNGACVHGDELAAFIVRRVEDEVGLGLGYVNGATVASNFVEAGYDLVVYDYCFEREANVARFLGACTRTADVFLFTLWAPLEIVRQREASRPGRTRLGARVLDSYETMGNSLDRLGQVVDCRDAPESVAARIDRLTMDSCGLLRAAEAA